MGGLFPVQQSATKAVDSILKDFELFEFRRVKSKHLSSGNRKKLSLAIAIIINPRVLFLESISDYLDPWSKLRIYAILQKSMSSRTSIVATNDTEDAEILCSRIGLLMDGQLKACGSKHDIKKEFAFGWVLTIKLFRKAEFGRTYLDEQMKALSDLVHDLFRSAAVLSIKYDSISFGIDKKELDIRKLQLYIESHHTKIYVENISLLHPTLEQVYFRIVHGEREGFLFVAFFFFFFLIIKKK
jgi:ABC-type multidrug transport system ATPase subunit